MATLNKVQLIGNLGRDPETRYTLGGTAVCTVSLATTNAWTDKQSGDRVEESEWHRVNMAASAGLHVEMRVLEALPAVCVSGRSSAISSRWPMAPSEWLTSSPR